MELIWLLFLNTLSFKFVPTPRKSLRFTRFRRSYVNHPAVVLTNCYQNYTAFLLDVYYSKWSCSFFIVEHTCCSNVVNSKVGRQMSRCEIVINISNLTLVVKHSIGRRTSFSPNLHSVGEKTLECFLILQH